MARVSTSLAQLALRRPVVLLTSADAPSRAEVASALASRGFAIEETAGLTEVLPRADAADAVLLAMDLPDATLSDALRMLGTRHPALVLGVLGAAEDEVDEVIALELGADFCLPRWAGPRLAAARLRAALRRCAPPAAAAPAGFAEAQALFGVSQATARPASLAGFAYDTSSNTARRPDGTEVPLTRAEAETLLMLAKAGGNSVSRERISIEVLGRPYNYADRTVDNLVLSLRRKLDMDAEYGPIRAVRNVGYRMVPAATREG